MLGYSNVYIILYYKPSIEDILKKYCLMISPSQLWFLVMILGEFIIFHLLFEKQSSVIVFGILFMINIIWGLISVPNIFQISSIVRYALFYYVGICLRKYKNEFEVILNNKKKIIMIGVIYIGISILYENITISNNYFVLYKTLLSLLGIFFWFALVNILSVNKNYTVNRVLSKYNFTIYLLHQQIIQTILYLTRNQNVEPTVVVILCIVLSLIISLAIGSIVSKIPRCRSVLLIS